MRQIAVVFLLTVLLACKKENREPVCRFSKIAQNGSTTKDPVTYHQRDTVVTIGEGNYGYMLYYNKEGKLIRREAPVLNPYERSELTYNIFGQVAELRQYVRQGSSWEAQGKWVYIYNNGKLVVLRAGDVPGPADEHYQVNWQGNDIVSVVQWRYQQIVCTVKFSYDGAMPNPMRQFSDFYYVDGNTNIVRYKLPYYFSEHLLTKQENDCDNTPEPLNFHYTFTASGLVESMLVQTGISTGFIWEYEYECR